MRAVVITPDEELNILERASVPEHIPGLMSRVSGADPYLMGDFLCFAKGGWVILVGYPLHHAFKVEDLPQAMDCIVRRFKPLNVSVIAPELPPWPDGFCRERESDFYYTLDIREPLPRNRVVRLAEGAGNELIVERLPECGVEHVEITDEFLARVNPGLRVKNLFRKMPEYVSGNPDAMVLSAWNRAGNLSAYFVVDLAAGHFSDYVIGCHSRRHYVKGASDLLFLDMIHLSRERGKDYIHLGLGVNEGIRRFKKKWGGKPTLRYEMCELQVRKPSIFETVARYLMKR